MRLIVLSDIHGSYLAFSAVIEEALKEYGNSIDGFIFLGDYTCDFLDGHKVIELIQKLKIKFPVYMIRGNREDMVTEYQKRLQRNGLWDINSTMGAPLLCCNRLTQEDIQFLETIPETLILKLEKCGPIFLKHKMLLTKEEIEELSGNNINTILTGHTHVPHIDIRDGISLYNPGSVALGDTGVPGANYGVMTWKNNKWHFEEKRVDYNYELEIAQIESNPLLFKACKNWGTVLIESIKTGLNITALYMFEARRIAMIRQNNPNIEEIEFNDNLLGEGRYGNTSYKGSSLREKVIREHNGEIEETYQFFKTDEGKNKQNVVISDKDYELALKLVLNYVRKISNNLESEVFKGRRTS